MWTIGLHLLTGLTRHQSSACFSAFLSTTGWAPFPDIKHGLLQQICSSAVFHPRRPWEGKSDCSNCPHSKWFSLILCVFVSWNAQNGYLQSFVSFLVFFNVMYWYQCAVVSGGLDSKIVKWDFSRGRPLHVVDLGGWFFSLMSTLAYLQIFLCTGGFAMLLHQDMHASLYFDFWKENF
jgi:hypothetical protein